MMRSASVGPEAPLLHRWHLGLEEQVRLGERLAEGVRHRSVEDGAVVVTAHWRRNPSTAPAVSPDR